MGHIFHWLEDINLRCKKGPINLAFEHLEIDDFYGNRLIRIIVSSLINLARVSFSNSIIQPIRKVLNFLSRIGFPLHQLLLWHFIIKNLSKFRILILLQNLIFYLLTSIKSTILTFTYKPTIFLSIIREFGIYKKNI